MITGGLGALAHKPANHVRFRHGANGIRRFREISLCQELRIAVAKPCRVEGAC
jgi:hypothetical protein